MTPGISRNILTFMFKHLDIIGSKCKESVVKINVIVWAAIALPYTSVNYVRQYYNFMQITTFFKMTIFQLNYSLNVLELCLSVIHPVVFPGKLPLPYLGGLTQAVSGHH